MSLYLVTAPSVEPLTLAEAKRHLRVEVDNDNDLIRSLTVAAREHVEAQTGRRLVTQTWDLKGAFPMCGPVWLPFAPATSVTSITYLDQAGVSQTWSSALYRVLLPTGPHAQRGYIEPAYGQSYPSTYAVSEAVAVRFVCGYGASGASVPASILAAMKLLVGHWYEQRVAVSEGNLTEVPLAVDRLLWPFKVF